jgi:hypothetical protein
VLGPVPYLSEASGHHYEETNSIGPHIAGFVDDNADFLIEFMNYSSRSAGGPATRAALRAVVH